MQAFRFKLEPVLRQRRAVEDQCQRDLAKVLRNRMILQNQLRRMQETIIESKHALSDTLVGRVDLERVGRFSRYSGQVAHRAQTIVLEMHRLERQVAVARSRLGEAMRDRRAMELLRDRRYAQWRKQQQRREAVMLDETATQRYVRRELSRIAS